MRAKTLLLEWTAPVECPSASAVEASVNALVQNVPSQPFIARIRIEQVSNRWVAILDAQHGERRLEGTSCREVVDTISLVLALALDPTAASRADTNQNRTNQNNTSQQGTALAPPETASDAKESDRVIQHAPTNRATAPPDSTLPVVQSLPSRQEPSPQNPPALRAWTASSKPQSPFEARARDQSRRSRDLTLGAGISIVGEVGALPNISYAGGGRVRLAGEAWAIALGYGYYPTQTATVHSSDASGRISLKVGFIEPCLATQLVKRRWEICTNLEFGKFVGEGSGLDKNYSGSTEWIAAVFSSGIFQKLVESAFVVPRLGVAFPFYRPKFETLGVVETIHRPAWFSVRAELVILAVF